MSDQVVLDVSPLEFPWQTADPFLFCVHHLDEYPEGNEKMGPDASLAGRNLGMDFEIKDGWRMYHGSEVPGFPAHPHRGFETVTIARQGYIDHSDSLGAAARFGNGDVQWMTAGKGVVHSEMFPLVKRDEPNTTELFQIWLNLPRKGKMAEPHFGMFWDEDIARVALEDEEGRKTEVKVVAGSLDDHEGPQPPPDSWAASAESDVAIWTIAMEPGARWTAPPAKPESNRMLYFFVGETMTIADRDVKPGVAIGVRPDVEVPLVNGDAPAELLLLQGRPIGEPVAQHGPFVMNHPGEIRESMLEYQRTRFGGWPWESDSPVHPRDKGRFAVHADGREETK